MPPARARIRYPTRVYTASELSGNYGMNGYDALVSILGQVQSILDALELWGDSASRKIDSAQRKTFCTSIAASASALTDLFDSTLPVSSQVFSYSRAGIYEEEAPIEIFTYAKKIRTDVWEPLNAFLGGQAISGNPPIGSNTVLGHYERVLEGILVDIRARLEPWFAEFAKAAAEYDETQRILQASRLANPQPQIQPQQKQGTLLIMVSNSTTSLIGHATKLSAAQYVGITVAVLFLSILYKFSYPPMDPREPPPLKADIPIPMVGHIIGFVRHGINYFNVLPKSQKSFPSAGTLPILNGKAYMLFDIPLIQSAIRHKNFTFDILSMEFAQRVFGLSDLAMEKVWGPDHDVETSVAPLAMSRIKSAMQGEHLYRMNVKALGYIAKNLNEEVGEEGWKVGSLYGWLRDFMTMATAEGVYGRENPIRGRQDLVDALWEFENNIQPLFLGVLPHIIARKAYLAREKVQAVLVPWYAAKKDHNPDVATIAKARADSSREFGMPDNEIGRLELALLFVATTNTIPTLYWFVTNIWLRRELVERLSKEALTHAVKITRDEKGRRTATVDISTLEERCPLMVACYRESIRLGNQGVGTRRIMRDTLLSDSKGNEYLFKAGVDLMWAAKELHRDSSAWGENVDEFDPERFLEENYGRAQKMAYVPFGGGRHLCPGRNFAFAENLGLMVALVVGFELEGFDKRNFRFNETRFGEAVAKPPVDAQGGEVTIRRRVGWEDVEWRFVC
ncbi:cytochrome P450 [Cercophora newfieldiana]|uniref:Cytochrome P450 n=1 Tax=Cercophora newfieldiana TaxID=92897 RepID=A0AA40CT07_9PEZI|nr:cytochrome P450 [Cercophora newfieldiana]